MWGNASDRGSPSREEVRKILAGLAKGSIAREQAGDFARRWMVPFNLSIRDKAVANALDQLLGADSPTTDRDYLYGEEDFKAWLTEFDGL